MTTPPPTARVVIAATLLAWLAVAAGLRWVPYDQASAWPWPLLVAGWCAGIGLALLLALIAWRNDNG